MITLHERLRGLRHQYGYRLREVAEMTGTSISYLSDVERGQTLPSLVSLEAVASVYGMSLSEVLEGVSVNPQYVHVPDYSI
jgi:transcriptional regulator with XRE-family HTH domain